MTSVLVDLRHALRVHVKNPGATAIAVFTLALAIGATTAIFSVVYGVLLRPLPFPASDRLMAIWEVNHRGTYSRLADPNFVDFRDRNSTFSAMAKFTAYVTPVIGAAEPVRTTVATVSKDFFTVLGIQPARGRGLVADDARMGAEPVAIVSHRFWVQWMDSAAVLSTFHVKVEDRVYTVVGVMPAGFQFPANVDLWRPAELSAENTSRTSHNYQGIGRLRDGVSVAQAAADISRLSKDIVRHSPEQGDYLMTDAAVLPLQSSLTRRVGSTLYVLLGAVCFLLLVACANVTNLLLAQAAARQRELAIRHALGAGPGRLVRLFVAEALVLLTASGLTGLLVAWLGTRALLSLAPAGLPRLDDVSMNGTVLAFAMGLSALVALALGLLTAARAARRDARDALVDGARGQTSASSQRVGRMIVTVQMAMTVVLLIGATLLGRSLLRVLSVDPGFRTEGIVAMDVTLPATDDPAAKTRVGSLYADLFDRLRAIPGVEQVAAANAVPLDGGLPDGLFLVIAPQDVPKSMQELAARFRRKDGLGTADYSAVSPRYFQTLGIPLRQGRLFDDRDGPTAPHVAVISESLARARWRDGDPIGATIEFGNMDGDLRPLTIVGVVGDTRVNGLEQPVRPTMYVNLMQRPRSSATVVMRTTLDPQAVIAPARRVLKEVAPDAPPSFRTFEQIYAASLGDRHFNLTLVTTFAGTALALAIAGIYGVMSYTVAQRRREIGVRVALGASRGQVFRLIVGQALATTAIGVTLGVMAALGLARTVERLLFGIAPTDPVTFASVIATLTAAAMLACYLPARRATHLDPIQALRED
jgi:putative ABC transport system permease protein